MTVAGCDCGEDPAGPGGAIDTGTGTPDTGASADSGTEDTGTPDTGNPPIDSGFDDTGNPADSGEQDAGEQDSGTIDEDAATVDEDASSGDEDASTIEEDAGEVDSGFDDAGEPVDGGTPDAAAIADAGVVAPTDAGPVDTGVVDAGRVDTGVVADAGPPDTGTPDSGPLQQPLSEFCQGGGAVVQVGGGTGGDSCAGQVAQNTFQYAICTCQTLSAQSNLTVDAFDSRVGPYGGMNVLEDGHIGVNGALSLAGTLTDLGSTFVAGGGFAPGQQSYVSLNVYSNGTANMVNSFSTIGRNMFVNGNVVGRFDVTQDLFVPATATVDPRTASRVGGSIITGPIPQIEPCPCGPGEVLDVQSYIDFGRQFNDNQALNFDGTIWENGGGPPTITLECGRYFITRITRSGSLTIHATARTVLYVEGDVTLSSGGLTLQVDDGAEIDLFIGGSLTLQAASDLGDPEHPSAVRTYIGGTAPMFIQANSTFGGNIFAPQTDVTFAGRTDIFGAIFAQNVIFNGAGFVHFDSAIREAGQACNPDGGVDGGVNDGGAPDTGVPPDAGPDAGVPDTGLNDAGQPVDAGTPDTGVVPDSGVAPDSGTCTRCDQCGQSLGCDITDAGFGVCGPCQNDLDCCPFEICTNGSCIPAL